MAEKENRNFGSDDNIQVQSNELLPEPTQSHPPPPPPPPRSPRNILNIRFEWELKHASPFSRGRSDSLDTPTTHLSRDSTYDGRPYSAPGDLSPREASESGSPSIPKSSIPSVLSFPSREDCESIQRVEYHLITKPPLDSKMAQQQAFIYMDKDAVISILSTLNFAHPVMSEIYLHTQVSPFPEATRSCDVTTIADFLEGFMDPLLDPILTNKLRAYWWSLECALPNGVIIIHSLARSTYHHVYIFKFSPVTGVFSKLVPQQVSDMRVYLEKHPNDPKFFPKVACHHMLSSQEKLRLQLGGSQSFASRSMTNLANAMRRMSGSGLSYPIQGFSNSLLNGIKNDIIPTLIGWNEVHHADRPPAMFTSLPNITSSNLSTQTDENTSTLVRSRRPSFVRSGSSSYFKHPLQTLRHQASSLTVLPGTPSRYASDNSLATLTPTIILTTPEQTTSILKLKSIIPSHRDKPESLWSSMRESFTPKRLDVPTFAFWKDVLDQISFKTQIPRKTSDFTIKLDTNINQQVSNDLSRLLASITDMYAKEADGIQLDFIQIRLPSGDKGHGPVDIRKLQNSCQTVTPKEDDTFSTPPETPTADNGIEFIDKPLDGPKNPGEEDFYELRSESSYGSIALSDDDEPTKKELRKQGQILANNMKPDRKLKLNFNISELQFSSVLLSPDTYLVEAVIAGWFADTCEWIKENDIHWKNVLFDHQAPPNSQ